MSSKKQPHKSVLQFFRHLNRVLAISSISANELSEEFLLPLRSTDKLLPLLLDRIIWG